MCVFTRRWKAPSICGDTIMATLKRIKEIDAEISDIIYCILEADRQVTGLTAREVEAFGKGGQELAQHYTDKINRLDDMVSRRRLEIYDLLLTLVSKER